MNNQFKVPFGTMSISDKAKQLINQSLESGRLSGGRLVRLFEERFAELVGAREAVAVSSGTDADTLALAVLHDFGAKRGDEIIVPALSFVATGNAVIHAGFRPVFVDVDRTTLTIAADRIEEAITENTWAIMPVHLMGKPADMKAIQEIAYNHNLYIIEDAAEAHGAQYKGRTIGSIGHLTAFSTYVAHIISTIEGGIITTNNEQYAEILRSLRSHGRGCACTQCILNTSRDHCAKRFRGPGGMDVRFTFPRIGYSCKMNELEAAVGLGNLDCYEEILNKRRQNLLHVIQQFTQFEPLLETIHEQPHERIGPHAIPIIVNEQAPFSRDELSSFLERNGIETRTLFASMPTQCPGFQYLNYRIGQFPNAEYIGEKGLHIGVHQDLTLEDMDYVLDTISHFLRIYQTGNHEHEQKYVTMSEYGMRSD